MFLIRAFLVWFVMLGVEFCHGALRSIFLSPLLGDNLARQLSVFTGSALFVLLAYLFIPWVRAEGTGSLLAVGFLWLILTVAFELSFGHYVFGMSWDAVLAEFNLLEGKLFPIGLVLLTLSPIIATRLRARRSARQPDSSKSD